MRMFLFLAALLCSAAIAHDATNDTAVADHQHKFSSAVPVQHNADGAVYGALLAQDPLAPVSIEDATANASEHAGKPGAYSGSIAKVCQKMGCWLVLSGETGDLARVVMHDHAFGVPKDAAGSVAIVYGTLSEKQLSAEEVAHLVKDGADAPANREFQIDATSVVIREG